MKKFMFYTNDGFTQDIDGKDIENCQILGWGEGVDINTATEDFNHNHSYLKDYKYENINSVEIITNNTSYNSSIERYEKSLEKGREYTEIIVSIGYIGLFTLLSFAKDTIDSSIRGKIAFCALLSLGFFIAWEIIKMLMRSVQEIKYHWKERKKEIIKICSLWLVFFLGAIIPLLVLSFWLFPALYQFLIE